jgi:hypothetical protein
MTNVVNARDRATQPGDVYIGRGGPWGNKFSHKPSKFPDTVRVATVEEAIARYRESLWAKVKAGEITVEQLAALHGKTLVCWCKPGPCHGDVLAAAAAWAKNRIDTLA